MDDLESPKFAREVKFEKHITGGLYVNIRANHIFGYYMVYLTIPYTSCLYKIYNEIPLHGGIKEEYHRDTPGGDVVIIGAYYNQFNDASDLNEFTLTPKYDVDFDNVYPFTSSPYYTVWTLKKVFTDTIENIKLFIEKKI